MNSLLPIISQKKGKQSYALAHPQNRESFYEKTKTKGKSKAQKQHVLVRNDEPLLQTLITFCSIKLGRSRFSTRSRSIATAYQALPVCHNL